MRISLPKRRPLRTAMLTAFVIIATGLTGLLFPAQAAASSSSLEVLDGIVAVSHDGGAFLEGRDGDLLQQGDVVRTGDDSHAILTFYDGSTVEVEPNTELVVETLAATSSGDILMTMRQDIGRTWHVVSRALTPGSKYEIKTPATTATVRGTAFLVSVDPNGTSNVKTTDGTVHAIAAGQEVPVPPGFETNVAPGAAPDPATVAPPPDAIVRVVVDPTPNALVVDPEGRSVGLLNGLPVRYVPGSTIQVIDGKLVITIPNPTLGRIDTHVQPAKPGDTAVDVNVQVIVNGATVGNVIEHRGIDRDGIAKGGVVITTNGTYILPDDDAKNSRDPRIGRLPPPPPGGVRVPFVDPGTPAPTPLVTPGASFVTRFTFDPRITVVATATPPPPSPTAVVAFKGAYQPYVAPTSTATPAPNTNLVVFTATSTDLTLLTLATPTPTPTLTTRLTAPLTAPLTTSLLLATPTPTPAPTFVILRSFDATAPLASSLILAPTPTPTPARIILSSPILLLTPPPTSAPPIVTLPPIVIISAPPVLLTPPPTSPPPSFIPVFSLPPIVIATPPPSPSPTPLPTRIILQSQILPPPSLIITTPPPTPAPTLPPILTQPIRILPTPTPTPVPTRPVLCAPLMCP